MKEQREEIIERRGIRIHRRGRRRIGGGERKEEKEKRSSRRQEKAPILWLNEAKLLGEPGEVPPLISYIAPKSRR